MKDARNGDPAGSPKPVIDDVRPRRETPHSRTDIVTQPPRARIARKHHQALDDRVNRPIRCPRVAKR